MTRPSRLYKRLKPSQPLFRIFSTTTDELRLDDDSIRSITITRGSSTPGPGPYAHTIEVESNEFHYGRTTGHQITCEMTDYGRSFIAQRIGASPTKIQTRFGGRVGKLTTEDTGGWWIYGKTTVLFGASAHAQFSVLDGDVSSEAGLNLANALQRRFRPSGLGQPFMQMVPLALYDGGRTSQYGSLVENTTFSGFDDAMTKLAGDTGIYIQTRRNGDVYFDTYRARWEKAVAVNNRNEATPVGRHQAISPAEWEQPSENLRQAHRVRWTNSSGSVESFVVGLDSTQPNIPVVLHDLTAYRFSDDFQPVHEALVHWYREQAGYYRVRSLTIDLLKLISSDAEYDHLLAKYLLEMEVGDPIYLSTDWVIDLASIHYAVGMKETITPDGWDIELNIANSAEVVGEYGVTPNPRIWEQFITEWDEERTAWH